MRCASSRRCTPNRHRHDDEMKRSKSRSDAEFLMPAPGATLPASLGRKRSAWCFRAAMRPLRYIVSGRKSGRIRLRDLRLEKSFEIKELPGSTPSCQHSARAMLDATALAASEGEALPTTRAE